MPAQLPAGKESSSVLACLSLMRQNELLVRRLCWPSPPIGAVHRLPGSCEAPQLKIHVRLSYTAAQITAVPRCAALRWAGPLARFGGLQNKTRLLPGRRGSSRAEGQAATARLLRGGASVFLIIADEHRDTIRQPRTCCTDCPWATAKPVMMSEAVSLQDRSACFRGPKPLLLI